jgi:hypothetical protein
MSTIRHRALWAVLALSALRPLRHSAKGALTLPVLGAMRILGPGRAAKVGAPARTVRFDLRATLTVGATGIMATPRAIPAEICRSGEGCRPCGRNDGEPSDLPLGSPGGHRNRQLPGRTLAAGSIPERIPRQPEGADWHAIADIARERIYAPDHARRRAADGGDRLGRLV